MGLVTSVLSLAREPVRLTLRAWELGLSTAAGAARLGSELLDQGRSEPTAPAERAPPPSPTGNGGPPGVERGSAAEPDVVVPETGYLAPEPGELGPEPDVLGVEERGTGATTPAAQADAPPPVPDELIPDHVDEEPVLVAESAEAGAEDGAGPELEIASPWDGYDRMTAADIRDRLAAATTAEAAAVHLYEASRKGRTSVLQAAERALKR